MTSVQKLGDLLSEVCLSAGLFSDILFKLEDGTLPAHKPLLMARSLTIFINQYLEYLVI